MGRLSEPAREALQSEIEWMDEWLKKHAAKPAADYAKCPVGDAELAAQNDRVQMQDRRRRVARALLNGGNPDAVEVAKEVRTWKEWAQDQLSRHWVAALFASVVAYIILHHESARDAQIKETLDFVKALL